MPINFDPALALELDEGIQTSEAVRLPWPIAYMWVVNGSPALEQIGGVSYHGGWEVGVDDFLDAAGAWNKSEAPSTFAIQKKRNRNGKAQEFYQTRSVVIAPIGVRKSWYTQDPSTGQIIRAPEYFPRARHHIQVLAMLATKGESGTYEPYSGIVLSAKGYQVTNLENSLSQWRDYTAKGRSRVAPGVPAWLFYLAVGTFGKEPVFQEVGKGNNTSEITPIGPYLPENLSDETLESLFVGQEVAEQMLDMKRQAKDWLSAWASRDNGQPAAPADAYGAPPPWNQWSDDDMPPPEDDIPF